MPKALTLLALLTSALTTGSLQAAETTPLVINEICSSNIDQWVDLSFNYGGWIEVYNPSESAINITGWYLSDDPDHLRKACIKNTTNIPARGYRILWFDNYHWQTSPRTIDMKLDCDGGTLYLSDAKGNLMLSEEYPEAVARCSWARMTDGGSEWQYCAGPTPGKKNDGAKFASQRLAAPEVDVDSKIFKSGSVTFNVTIPEGCTLKYTIDGSTPTLEKGTTSAKGYFTTSTSRNYRFRLFKDGYLPSPVVTRCFIRDTHTIDLPVIHLLGTQANFYGDSLGIFTKGVNGRRGRGQNTKCNWNADWERPAVFEYYPSTDEAPAFTQEVGVERCGGWSRAWSPWSFKVKGSKQYEGQKTMDYPFFKEKPYLKHRGLQIRNGGNDNTCRIKDAALQQIIARSGLNIDYQAYQPVGHFVNGVWKGTINMREPNNKHFVYANYGLDDDEIDMFEMSPDSGYCQMCGDKEAWKRLVQWGKSSTVAGNYEKICSELDIDEFCNYMAVELYLVNWDWPQNNVKGFRPRREDGRWRFILYDLDNSFDGNSASFTSFAGKQTYTFDQLYDCSVSRYTKEIELVTLFVNLLRNDTFRKKFIDTFCLVTYSVFDPDRSKQIVNEMANYVAATQGQYNYESPWGTANEVIRQLSASRQSTMMTQLKNYSAMRLTGKTPQTASIAANVPQARLLFNGMELPNGQFNGRFYSPLTLTAEAPAGYEFVGWKTMQKSTKQVLGVNATWRYYDRGSLDNMGWQLPTYNDATWGSGQAPLGYYTDGTRDYKTKLNYGTSSNKRPTYYLRTTFELADKPGADDSFDFDITVDDGVIVYVNGTEAARYNMPSGKVYYNTFASSYAEGNPDKTTLTLPASLFSKGQNLIAVELHNNSATSTDVYFSGALTQQTVNGTKIETTDPTYQAPSTGSISVMACFEPKAQSRSLHPVVINEVSAGNTIFASEYMKRDDWVELYNTTDHDIDLEGMFLTDRENKPEKYRITAKGTQASTLLPAHGYKIIWCDKRETKTELHAPFKLDNDRDGRLVMLTAADGSWSDTLTYVVHGGEETVGRYPDGAPTRYLLSRPSIASSNVMTSYSTQVTLPNSNAAIQAIASDQPLDNTYCIYDLSGRLVATGQGAITEQGLSRGVYVVKSGRHSHRIIIP